MDRPDWDSYFLMIAKAVASRSTCLRRKVGAVLVRDRQILSTGDNGAPKGIIHCEEAGCLREKLGIPSAERHEICRGSHAAINAIAPAAYAGVSTARCWLYCTHEPCVYCTKALINCGCTRIVYLNPYPDKISREIISQSGVETLCIPEESITENNFSTGGSL